jgi:hypothetical protein
MLISVAIFGMLPLHSNVYCMVSESVQLGKLDISVEHCVTGEPQASAADEEGSSVGLDRLARDCQDEGCR